MRKAFYDICKTFFIALLQCVNPSIGSSKPLHSWVCACFDYNCSRDWTRKANPLENAKLTSRRDQNRKFHPDEQTTDQVNQFNAGSESPGSIKQWKASCHAAHTLSWHPKLASTKCPTQREIGISLLLRMLILVLKQTQICQEFKCKRMPWQWCESMSW